MLNELFADHGAFFTAGGDVVRSGPQQYGVFECVDDDGDG